MHRVPHARAHMSPIACSGAYKAREWAQVGLLDQVPILSGTRWDTQRYCWPIIALTFSKGVMITVINRRRGRSLTRALKQINHREMEKQDLYYTTLFSFVVSRFWYFILCPILSFHCFATHSLCSRLYMLLFVLSLFCSPHLALHSRFLPLFSPPIFTESLT